MTLWFFAVIFAVIIVFLYMVLEAHRNTVIQKNLALPGLPDAFEGFTLYFISDVHRRRISEKMLAHIKAPDVVIIGGDLTEKGVPFGRVEQNLVKLKRWGVPVLFVWGNHDRQVNDVFALHRLLQEQEIIVLENRSFSFERNQAVLNVIGVDDATTERDDLPLALSSAKPGFRILVSHNPIIVDKITPEHQIPLVLSGHTHGGQIRLFGWGLREAGGLKAKPFGTLVISAGYGTTHLHLRLGAKADTWLITLKKDQGLREGNQTI